MCHIVQTVMMHVIVTVHINPGELHGPPLHFSYKKQGQCCHQQDILVVVVTVFEYLFNSHWYQATK
jgi:hypothetical protein